MNMLKTINKGVWPVLLTPFQSDLSIDWTALDELLDYYMHEGVAGVFPVSTSSEMFDLTTEESLEITKHIVSRVNDRINVVATGNFGKTLADQENMIKRMHDTGVDAVVIGTSLLPNEKDLKTEILELAERVRFPLGIYETPFPEHKTLDPNDIAEIASTGCFVFLKETSRQVPVFQEKVNVAHGTPLRVFQANLNCLLNSGLHYGSGFAGCAANVIPRLICDYLSSLDNESRWHHKASSMIRVVEKVMNINHYPASAKYFLSRLGLNIQHYCRWEVAHDFNDANAQSIDHFIQAISPCLKSGDNNWRFLDLSVECDIEAILDEWKNLAVSLPID